MVDQPRNPKGLKPGEAPLDPEERALILDWQRRALQELKDGMQVLHLPYDDVAKHITERTDPELQVMFEAYLAGCKVDPFALEEAWKVILPNLEKISDANRGHILNMVVRVADGDATMQAVLLARALCTFVHNTWQWMWDQYGQSGCDLLMEHTRRHLVRYDNLEDQLDEVIGE